MLELEVLVVLSDSALAKGDELLALGESANRYRPFLESNWHGLLVRLSGVSGEVAFDSDEGDPAGAAVGPVGGSRV